MLKMRSLNPQLRPDQRLTKQDVRLLNAYENLTGRPKTVVTPKHTIAKSELDAQLETYKLTKLNDLFSSMYTQVNEGAQNIASKWAVALQALENLKNEVDLNNFLTYSIFNSLYGESLDKLDDYQAQIQAVIDMIDDFCISMKAIVPDPSITKVVQG